MELNIKRKEDEMVVSFGNEKLSINLGEDKLENNTSWNTQKINDFLISLASSLAPGDKIEFKGEQIEGDSVYNHIVSLFEAFSVEYNKE